ncbi:phosphoglycerate mutase-like protein [Myriangium duriaei CBS 260.36]|uniref:Phosphoglycerate mutase-like protein n=1 Tax=Myriangium duriaei CBS 260.36 TaxID=1168546 RepID=A0A9P4MLI3_9PEZI|nr:phosphoglycerate mutase-like protein [Myriangium duriaei CBS 260.36]
MPSFISALILSASALAAAKYTFDPLQHLSGIAPYFEPEDPPFDPAPPQGCNVTRAAYLVRHAAIIANDFDYESYIEPFVKKINASRGNSSIDWNRSHTLAFLSTWTSPISDSDIEKLSKVGELEAMKLGVDIYARYPDFKQPQQVWTSTAERTERSAKSFVEGLAIKDNVTSVVSVSEAEEEGADSLTPYEGCPAYSSSRGSSQSKIFQDKYTAPIISRFHSEIPAFNWTSSDVYAMQQLCGYETVIRGDSPFCSLDLFSANEWLQFEYTNDLMYWHNTGYGNPISGVLGFPWVNATAELLTSSNASQDLFVSFTHRELPPTVLVTLGLFNNSAFSASNDVNATMPNDTLNYQRTWQSSKFLPFLTNIAIERLECDSFGYQDNANQTGEYYRLLVNQSPQFIDGCVDGPGMSCSRVGFQNFIAEKGQRFGGYSEKCGVSYKNSTDVLSIY